jgi:hypothetical protein
MDGAAVYQAWINYNRVCHGFYSPVTLVPGGGALRVNHVLLMNMAARTPANAPCLNPDTFDPGVVRGQGIPQSSSFDGSSLTLRRGISMRLAAQGGARNAPAPYRGRQAGACDSPC